MSERLSRREAAAVAGLSESALRYHLAAGNISAGADGLLDRQAVLTLRSAQRVAAVRTDERSAALLKVRVLGGAVKVKQLRLSIEAMKARTVERTAVEATMRQETDDVLARIHSWPERHAEAIAQDLGIHRDAAHALLEDFAALALSEMGDIRREGADLLARV
jgi:hypothetical protein